MFARDGVFYHQRMKKDAHVSTPAAPSRSDALLKRGIDRLNAGKHTIAETIFRELLAQDPHHPDALHQLGVSLSRQSRHA